ncbi:MAG: glycosidase [Proteobacteria bacterium]|nr:glycosidase [Pseudomonadota bacterium]
MSRYVDFNVEDVTPLVVEADHPLKQRDFLSPYVWRQGGKFVMLVRSAPRTIAETGNTGTIHYGESDDGIRFRVYSDPVIAPDECELDLGGCEDPTVTQWNGEFIVFYTGVDRAHRSGQMLYARGPSLHQLTKCGVAYASSESEGNTKEATVERTADGRWRLFFEFARNDASLVGLALGADVDGPWTEQPAPFAPRPRGWDNWHLSTGPLLTSDESMPVMFYNGATRDARWRIGWIAFNRDYTEIVDRCVEPLVVPPPPQDRGDTDIAFAASCIAVDEETSHLYFSRADQLLLRAVIRRS